jgi:hypothetical protein
MDKRSNHNYVHLLQLMPPSREPMKVMLRKLMSRATQRSFETRINMDEFLEELLMIRECGTMELPPNTVRRFRRYQQTDTLECAGFSLSNM